MAKKPVKPAAQSEQPDKKTYLVAEGVDVVNGAKVPANRKVELSPSEALYDLSLGRIFEEMAKPAAGKPAAKDAG